MRREPTFLPLTPWMPVAGVRAQVVMQAVAPAAVGVDAAWTSVDGAAWTEASADLGTHPRKWERFGVRPRGSEEKA